MGGGGGGLGGGERGTDAKTIFQTVSVEVKYKNTTMFTM